MTFSSEPPVKFCMVDPQASEQQAKPKGTHERQGGKTVLIGETERMQFYLTLFLFW